MIAFPSRDRASVDAQINIVPYIDVMLVLLVIFMMTTPIIEQGIELDLPNAEAEMVDFTEQQPTVISINKNGEYFINSFAQEESELSEDEQITLPRLLGRVKARLQTYPQMKVFVRGDKNVAYGSVVTLMSILQENGVNKVGLITESSSAQ